MKEIKQKLESEIFPNPNVYGIGTICKLDDILGMTIYIEVSVKDQLTKEEIESYVQSNYSEYDIRVVTRKMTKIQ